MKGPNCDNDKHICGHLWHTYSVKVKGHSGDRTTVQSDDFHLTNRNPWFSSLLVSSNLLSTNS